MSERWKNKRVFYSLNNLELETLELYKTLEVRLSATTLSLFPPARIANGATLFNFWPEFAFLWRQLPHGDQMPGHVGFAYTHCLPGLIQFLQLFGILVHEQASKRFHWVYFQVSGMSSWQHCMKIKCYKSSSQMKKCNMVASFVDSQNFLQMTYISSWVI